MQLSFLESRVLRPGYTCRILILRLVLVWLSAAVFDAAQQGLALGTWGGSSWSWWQRGGVLGLMLPLVLNAWGLLWPLLHMQTFEEHHLTFHRVLAGCTLLGKVLEQLSGLTSTSTSSCSCQQDMLLHGALLVVHQDPQFVSCLAALLLGYSWCHACCGPRSLAALTSPAALAAGNQQGDTVSADLASLTTGSNYFVNSFLAILAIHRLYNVLLGPREQPQPLALLRNLSSGSLPSGKASNRQSLGDSRRVSAAGAPSSGNSNLAAAVGKRVQTQFAAAATEGPSCADRSQQMVKVAAVSACQALFLGLFVLQGLRWKAQQQSGSAAEEVGMKGPAPRVLMVAGTAAVLLHIQALYCLLQPYWLQQYMYRYNTAVFLTNLAARCYLSSCLALDTPAGGLQQGAQGSSSTLQHKHVYRQFLVLSASAAAQEGHVSWLGLQLVATAVICCCQQLQQLLLHHSTAEGASNSLWLLPEYAVVVCAYLAAYPSLCSQAQGPAGEQLGPSTEQVGASATSSRNSYSLRPSMEVDPATIFLGREGRRGPTRRGSTRSLGGTREYEATQALLTVSAKLAAARPPSNSSICSPLPAAEASPEVPGSQCAVVASTQVTAAAAPAVQASPTLAPAAAAEPAEQAAPKVSSGTGCGAQVSPATSAAAPTPAAAGAPPTTRPKLPYGKALTISVAAADTEAPAGAAAGAGAEQVSPSLAGVTGILTNVPGSPRTPRKLGRRSILWADDVVAQQLGSGLIPAAGVSDGFPWGPIRRTSNLGGSLSTAEGIVAGVEGAAAQLTSPATAAGSGRVGAAATSATEVAPASPGRLFAAQALGSQLYQPVREKPAGWEQLGRVSSGGSGGWSTEHSQELPAEAAAVARQLYKRSASGAPSFGSISLNGARSSGGARESYSSRGTSCGGGRATEGGAASEAGSHFSEALTGPRSSRIQRRQYLASDLLLLALSLPANVGAAWQLLVSAWQSSAQLAFYSQILGGFAAAVLLAAQVPHGLCLLLRPKEAVSNRDVLLPVTAAVKLTAQQAAMVLLQQSSKVSPRSTVMFIAASLGMVNMSVPAFAAWLQGIVTISFGMHALQRWQDTSWGSLAIEAIECNLYPIAAFAMTRFASSRLQALSVRLVLWWSRRHGSRQLPYSQETLTVIGTVVAQLLLGAPLQWVLHQSSMGYTWLLDPLAAVDAGKALLVRAINSISHPEALDQAATILGIAVGFMIPYALQLLLVHLPDLLRKQPGGIQSSRPVSHRGRCTTVGGLGSEQQRLRNLQRMAVDGFAAASSWPVLLLTLPRLLNAALWPPAQILLVSRLLAAAGAISVAVTNTMHPVLSITRAAEVLPHRQWWWCLTHGWQLCTQAWAVWLVGLPPLWPAMQEVTMYNMAMGIMHLSWKNFAFVSPAVTGTCFTIYALGRWSTTSKAMLAYEAVEFGMYSIAAYGISRLMSLALFNAVTSVIQGAVQRAAPAWSQQKPDRLLVVASLTSHMVVAASPMYLALLTPLLPPGLDPLAALQAFKAATVAMLERTDTSLVAQVDTFKTLGAMLGVGVCFLVVSSIQALVLNNPAFRNPRLRWYEGAKTRVVGLGVRTMSTLAGLEQRAGPKELQDVLLSNLWEVTEGCFPGCTLLLVLLEDSSLDSGMAQRYLVRAAPEAADLPVQETLLLPDLPSVEAACRRGTVLYKGNAQLGRTGYDDWEYLAESCGMDGFLVAPLSCANQDLGALMVTSTTPVTLDRYARRLMEDLAAALSQALYTLACIAQMRAGEEIIHDILPEKVAEQLKRRVVNSDPSTQSVTPRTPHVPHLHVEAPWAKQHSCAGTSSSLLSPQTPLSRSRSFCNNRKSEVPVVYKQWHGCVSVLFADISGYTAMSQLVEPEQVMEMLHELYSKYDNICKQYGVYKVETIGDCYMACAGLLTEDPDHAHHMVQMGEAMLTAAGSVQNPLGGSVHIRVGIHSGRVMSGIVGSIRARYCLFGDTVNTASRMESTGVVDHIQISEDTYQLLGDLQSDFEPQDPVVVKGKGLMNTYLLRIEVAEALQYMGVSEQQSREPSEH